MSTPCRRRFLSGLGLAGASGIFGPFLRGLDREARGQPVRKKRLVVVAAGNGLLERYYTCPTRSEVDFDLTESLSPFAPWKKQLIVVQKLYNPHGVDTHGNHWATLCVTGKRASPGGITIDRLVAKHIGTADPVSSTNVMLWDYQDAKDSFNLSADGPGQEYPGEWNPLRLHTKLFGKTPASAPADAGMSSEALVAQNQSVLDFVAGQIQRLEAELAGPERAKLQQYLESVRGVEKQVVQLARARAASNGGTGAPTVSSSTDFKDKFATPEVLRALVDTSVNALIAGLTRVSTVSILGNSGSFKGWLFPDGSKVLHHNVMHSGGGSAAVRMDKVFAGEAVHIWERLRAVPEGGGTMADNTLLLFLNSGGGVHHGGHNNHCMILLGSAGGYFRTGRYLTIPPMRHAVSDLYVSVANAMDVPIRTFGDPGICKGPLPGLV